MTQKEMILNHMRMNGSISSMEAFQMGITRLSARIWDIKHDGVAVGTRTVRYKALDGKNKHYDEYFLEGEK